MVWKLTTDRYGLTDHFIFSLTEIGTCGEYTEPSVAKISTLDFPVLLVFVTSIIHMNKNLIFSIVALEIRVVFRHQTILKFSFWNSTYNQRIPTCFCWTHKQTSIESINIRKNSKEAVELCWTLQRKLDSSPLQIKMCKPVCYTCFLWCKAHKIVLHVDFEKLCQTENFFKIKILKQRKLIMQQKLNGFTDIRVKRDKKIHFEDLNRTSCVKNSKNKIILCRTENFQCIF